MRILKVIRIVSLLMSFLMLEVGVGNTSESATANRQLMNKTATDRKVAILDSGSNIVYKQGLSLIDGTVKDYNGHGTLMANIVKEVYPQVQLYIIKVMGKDGLAVNEEAIILGLEWAISRDVDVINMSLRLQDSEKLRRVIKKAYDKGIAIVAAAGNTNSRMGILDLSAQAGRQNALLNICQLSTNPQYEVAYPAKYEEVISVGALDRYGRVYDMSVNGKDVEIYCKGYKGNKAGTSVASAYAAGYLIKIISENPNADIKTVRQILFKKYGKRI